MTVRPEQLPKRARARPAKKNMIVETSKSTNASTPVYSNAFDASQSTSATNVCVFELALIALPMKVRASIAGIYRIPLVHWKVCLEPNIFFYTTLYNDC
jgi:hypothetical protein